MKYILSSFDIARNNNLIIDKNKDANEAAKDLTEWFQSMNELCISSRSVVIGGSDVPKWYTRNLQSLKENFKNAPPGPSRKQARNLYVKEVRKAKGEFTRGIIGKSKGGVWKLLNNRKSHDFQSMIKASQSSSNESELAEEFASFFKNKVNNLKRSPNSSEIFEALHDKFKDYPRWDITTCTPEDVARAIDDLRPTLSSGADLVPNRLIKSLKFEALDSLTSVFNKCISENVFPDVWKISKVLPTFKKGDKTKIQNFRPVCLYSTLGKLFESVIRKQILEHLENVLPSNMFGFRPGRSTQDAVSGVIDKIRNYRANGKFVAILSMDASSAFDLLPHSVILRSLEVIGAGPKFINWTKSFLSNCKNFVQIGEAQSSTWSVDTGSGQGRRMSPDYFNLSTISQAILTIISEFFGYADDGMDVVYGSNTVECDTKLQQIAKERVEWYGKVGLSLNPDKTEIIGFGYDPAPISILGHTIVPKPHIKFLGFTIQKDLKWSIHLEALCNKVRSAAGRIRMEGRNFSVQDKRLLFNGWIQSQIYYNARIVLPSLNKSDLSTLQTACNSGIRAVWGLPKYGYADITNIRAQLKIPSVETIMEQKLLEAAWKAFSSSTQDKDFHQGPLTRSKKLLQLRHPIQHGHLGKTSTSIITNAWNRMPYNIKTESVFKVAKSKIKEHCLSHI